MSIPTQEGRLTASGPLSSLRAWGDELPVAARAAVAVVSVALLLVGLSGVLLLAVVVV